MWLLTLWDLIEGAAIAALWVYAWGSPIRFAACSTVFALVAFHVCARYFIGLFGAGADSAIAVGVIGAIISTSHLRFDYSNRGLATGISFALMPIFAGLAARGWVPIVYQQGPGAFDFWTLVSLCAWTVWLIIAFSIWSARNEIV